MALSYTRKFWPEQVYLTSDASESKLAKRLLSRLPSATKVVELDNSEDPLSTLDTLSSTARFDLGKKRLMLAPYRGDWLKSCPGTQEHVCCNLWIVNPGEGCPMDCTYCYLQSYLKRNPTLKLYTNTEEMISAIARQSDAHPNRLFRIGTGELIDSLVWDDLTDLTLELVPFFASRKNLVLELKTKSNVVENLLELKNEHRGQTVVSWSVNAKSISEKDEASTASLAERVEAAQKVIQAGYRVGLHFDPLVYFDGWQDEYSETVKYIFSKLKAENIAWISVSTLRYKKEMQSVMIERFPKSKLPYGEQFTAVDNKRRYIQPIRAKMSSFVWNELKSISSSMPVYMCMESSTLWKQIAGGSPVKDSELIEVFSKQGRLPIV